MDHIVQQVKMLLAPNQVSNWREEENVESPPTITTQLAALKNVDGTKDEFLEMQCCQLYIVFTKYFQLGKQACWNIPTSSKIGK